MRSPGAAFDLRAALSAELRSAISELEIYLQDASALHRCRLHLKRARALARVGRVSAPGLAGVFNDTARGVMRTLGHARDVTALARAARRIRKDTRGKTRAAMRSLVDDLEAECAALPRVDIEAASTGLRDLLALAQVWPESSARQIRRGGERIARRARRAFKHARANPGAAERHEWRKREKDRLYAALLLGGAWPTRGRRKSGARLTDTLGHERDAALLLERVHASLLDEKAQRRIVKMLRKVQGSHAARADALGARVHAGGA